MMTTTKRMSALAHSFAEELHFTRAAGRPGIKQPSLSLQIRQLERGLRTSLFHRLMRGVELTESGALLLDEARVILDQVERIKAGVQSRARGESKQPAQTASAIIAATLL
jgi:DNA-binding transcriptional LysR family regulator